MRDLKRFLRAFRVKREEALASVGSLIIMYFLNFIAIRKYFGMFSKTDDNNLMWDIIWRFRVSGFDPITYGVLTDWGQSYNVVRHPLLSLFVFPFYLINQALMWLTGLNLAQVVILFPLLFCSFYSFIFIYRITREIIGVERKDATLLSFFLFSFGYVMLTFMVPDHFAPSMLMIVLCLYISGKCMQKGRNLRIWQTVLMFLFTAGTTLSNGIKVFLDSLFVNGKHFFRPKYFLLAVILPSAIIWGVARWEDFTFVKPSKEAIRKAHIRQDKLDTERMLAHFKDTTSLTDSATIMKVFKYQRQQQRHKEYVENHQKPGYINKGKPISDGEFLIWTDITTSRWDSAVENIFGESIQLHEDYLLHDTLRDRPLFVRYNNPFLYSVEALIVFLTLLGIWFGRRSKFLWMCLSGVAFDALIHVVLGFGLNEIYIMSAHWIFIIPIAISYIFRRLNDGFPIGLKVSMALRCIIFLLTLHLYLYNMRLIYGYFL